MGGFVSRPSLPPPQPPKPTVVETPQVEPGVYGTIQDAKRRGRRATILTGPEGAKDLGKTNIQKKTLLGA